jgi:hypothetical protein
MSAQKLGIHTKRKFKKGDLVKFKNKKCHGSHLTFKVAYRYKSRITLDPFPPNKKEGTHWQWFSDKELELI